MVMRWLYGLCLLGLLASSTLVHADAASRLVERYVQALQQRDDTALAALLTEDTRIKVTLLMGQEPPMVISLTRAEYLQQQRALWNFASDHAVTVGDRSVSEKGEGASVTFEQKERYKLLQGTLNRNSQMTLRTRSRDGKSIITEIQARIRQW
ncbi:hypothetical protein [Alloalcanivorax xenomutans]|jgi:hypothetical protein|uniref:hypothetical protein n=1 Tax=Alloalcanivorax xenomutans TaxID=1094342 RepID=UPI0003B8CDA7|nr:hypothetical protein Q668_07505 [Alcanivorax sp. PN-3]